LKTTHIPCLMGAFLQNYSVHQTKGGEIARDAL
jgi:hypothetical protein